MKIKLNNLNNLFILIMMEKLNFLYRRESLEMVTYLFPIIIKF